MNTDPFSQRLLHWFDQHGRHDLPWQHPRDPYRVWLSEVMLQQTQVSSVIGYFERFVDALPDRRSLAQASQDQVLSLWSGLGYYARGRNLHRCAQQLEQDYPDSWPQSLEQWQALPGIGRSTAGAILAQSFGIRAPILDGNVKRVLSRYHAIDGYPGERAIEQQLWALAESHTPHQRLADYTQAIMDLGATLCRRSKPACELCPVQPDCQAASQGQPEGYPGKKPKKTHRPERHCRMLILQRADGRILLERQPPNGLWGGLYSFPQTELATDAVDHCQQQLGLSLNRSESWPSFVHKFSHFDLHIEPLFGEVSPTGLQVRSSEPVLWYPDQRTGLPKPVQTLLEQVELKGKNL